MANPFTNGYKEPVQPSNYFKTTEGVHLVRIITPKTEVLSYFVEYKEDPQNSEKNIKVVHKDKGDGVQPINTKRVWSMLVLNYEQQKVQVAEFPQKAIQEFLFNIANGKIKNDWTKFDIQITRTGQALDTKYTCIAGDTIELTEELVLEIESQKSKINLKAMETGQDPFDTSIIIED